MALVCWRCWNRQAHGLFGQVIAHQRSRLGSMAWEPPGRPMILHFKSNPTQKDTFATGDWVSPLKYSISVDAVALPGGLWECSAAVS